jgi:hypothetical protein
VGRSEEGETMKVCELIKKLRELPQDAEVEVSELDGWTHLRDRREPEPRLEGDGTVLL